MEAAGISVMTFRLSPLTGWVWLILLGGLTPAGAMVRTLETPRVLNFSKSDYQAGHQNWGIAQSPEGYLYFANQAGMLEYDGSRWQLHPLPDEQTVRSIACDQQGRIFVGGFAEFGYWERQSDGQLSYYSLSEDLPFGETDQEEIWNIILTPQAVFFQSFSTVYRYDYERVTEQAPPGNIMFLQRVDSSIIVPVIEDGLYALGAGGQYRLLPGTQALADKSVMCLLPWQSGLLIGTREAGMFYYRNGQLQPWSNPLNPTLAKVQPNRAVRLSNGQIVIGTILDGVYILDPDGQLRYHLNKNNGLQNNTVLGLREDRAHNLWVAMDKGVDLIPLNEPLVFYQDRAGKIGTVYTAALFGGRLYVGSNQGLFVRPWLAEGAADFELVEGSQGQVWELRVLDGQLLCGHNDGTFRVERDAFRPISPITGGWNLIEGPPGSHILLQGTYTGIVVYEKDGRGLWQFSHRLEEFTAPVEKLAFDSRGWLWAANPYKGLYRLKIDDPFRAVEHVQRLGLSEGLPTEYHLTIRSLNDRLIVGAKGAHYSWKENQQRFEPLQRLYGDTLRNPSGVLLPGEDSEWFKILPQRIHWMQGDQMINRFTLDLVDGRENIVPLDKVHYLFCLDNGYALLDRRKNQAKAAAHPRPIIRRVASQRDPALAFAPPYPEHSPLTFPAAHNDLRFRYTLPFYPQRPDFQYKLEGFTSQWSDWKAAATETFTNLRPGRYTFRVRSSLSPETAAVTFTVQPHWRQTWWAKALYLVLGLTLAWILWRWHLLRLERQRRKLEIEKDRQLQQQRIQARNEQLQADVINKSKELANSTYNLIRKNEILTELKAELQRIAQNPNGANQQQYNHRLRRLIDRHLSSSQDWALFESNFNEVHDAFFKKLKGDYPKLSPGDLKLAAYIKMDLSSKEIAPLLNISVRGVENKRYRLRKKMGLEGSENLAELLMRY